VWPMIKGFLRRGGASWGERIASMRQILKEVFASQDQTSRQRDPVARTRQDLIQKDAKRLADIEAVIQSEIQQIVASALQSKGRAS
jgi:TPP-dependent pyruvate/acetoin dehydrogenase alpha subunit